MSKKPRRKPYDPAEAQRMALAREERESDRKRLGAQTDVAMNDDQTSEHFAARQDAFECLWKAKPRPAISLAEYNAARRFMADVDASLGSAFAASGQGSGRVYSDPLVIPPAIVALVMASERVIEVRTGLGIYWFNFLLGLVMPPLTGVAAPWREFVHHHTREANERAQTALVRQACAALLAVYIARDYGKKAA